MDLSMVKTVKGNARVCAQVSWLHVHRSFHIGLLAPDGIRREGGMQEGRALCSL